MFSSEGLGVKTFVLEIMVHRDVLFRAFFKSALNEAVLWAVELMLFCPFVSRSRLLGLTTKNMSEGECKQASDTSQDGKPEAAAAASTGQGVSSLSPPVSMATPPAATAATEDEEEESEDESEILEESPCGRWQKRREEVNNSRGFVNEPPYPVNEPLDVDY